MWFFLERRWPKHESMQSSVDWLESRLWYFAWTQIDANFVHSHFRRLIGSLNWIWMRIRLHWSWLIQYSCVQLSGKWSFGLSERVRAIRRGIPTQRYMEVVNSRRASIILIAIIVTFCIALHKSLLIYWPPFIHWLRERSLACERFATLLCTIKESGPRLSPHSLVCVCVEWSHAQ